MAPKIPVLNRIGNIPINGLPDAINNTLQYDAVNDRFIWVTAPVAGQASVILGSRFETLTAGSTRNASPSGQTSENGGIDEMEMTAPRSGTLSNFYCRAISTTLSLIHI